MSPLEIKSLIVDVPDFPKPGIVFKDITPVLANPVAFNAVTELLAQHAARMTCDAVLAIESRGFIIGAPLAQRLNDWTFERVPQASICDDSVFGCCLRHGGPSLSCFGGN